MMMRMLLAAVVMVICASSVMAQISVREAITPDIESRIAEEGESYFKYSERADVEKFEKIKAEYEEDVEKVEVAQGEKYTVMKPQLRRTDGDCSCPTVNYYYRPYALASGGSTWYPVGQFFHQWVKVGRCLDNRVCHTDKSDCPWSTGRCTQQYEYKGFFVYRRLSKFPYVEFSYRYFRIPDSCNCPHCTTCTGRLEISPIRA